MSAPTGATLDAAALRRLFADGFERTPALILACGLALTGALLLLAREASLHAARFHFEASTVPLVRSVDAALRNYVGLARATGVLFDASPARSGSRHHVAGRVLSESYPSAEPFAFVRWVPDAELAGYLKSRAGTRPAGAGGPAVVRNRSAGAVHLLVEQVFPEDPPGSLVGENLAADPDAVAAMRRAEAGRNVALMVPYSSSRLVADGIPVLVAPVYGSDAAGAAPAPVGFVLLKANFGSIVAHALNGRVPAGYDVRIGLPAAGSERKAGDKPLAAYGAYPAPEGVNGEMLAVERAFEVGIDRLVARVSAPVSAVPTPISRLPLFTALAGVALSLLAWVIVTSLSSTRRRAVQLAQEMTIAARRSDQRFRTLVESSRDWIWEVDEHGALTYTSPNCRELLGYEPKEMLGRPWTQFVLGQPAGPGQSGSFPDGPPKAYQMRLHKVRAKDGEVRVFEGSGTPFSGPDGRFAGMRGIDRDVTTRVRVRERLADLQGQLESASQFNLASQLLAGMAHELNRPLSEIASCNQFCIRLLERGDADSAQILQLMRAAAESAHEAGEVIRRLRGFMAKREVKVVALPIGGPLLDALALVEPQLRAQQVEVVTEIEPGLPPVNLDTILILQVILNLISNAVDAMRNSPQRVLHLRARKVAGQVAVEVLDTGEGVPPEGRARLFDWYYTTKSQGMGVGLAISRSIVEAHEGNLAYEALPDGGSRFTLWLPVAKPVEDVQRAAAGR